MRILLGLVALALLFILGCDLTKETKGEADQAGGAASGVAQGMSKGTLGDYDDEGNYIGDTEEEGPGDEDEAEGEDADE